MKPACYEMDMLVDLEARHDDLLRRLTELDRRVSELMRQWQPSRESGAPVGVSGCEGHRA